MFDDKINTEVSLNEILHKTCHQYKDSVICIDARYLKYLIKIKCLNSVIMQHFITVFSEALKIKPSYKIHLSLKSVSILDVEKYGDFINDLSQKLNDMCKNSLEVCYIYNPSFLFSFIHSMFEKCVPLESRKKIKIVKNLEDVII